MPPAIIGAGIAAAGALGGAVISSKSNKKAIQAQQDSTAQQLAFQRDMYNRTYSSLQPEMASGNSASTRIDQLLGLASGGGDPTAILRSQPGYQFRMNEALEGVKAGASANGMSRSGAAYKALEDRGYDVADQGYNTYLAQLTDVANRGSAAKSTAAGVSQNYANASSLIAQAGANAQSNAALLQGQNQSNALAGLLGALGQAFPSSYGTNNTPTAGQAPDTPLAVSVPWYMRG